MRYAVVRAPVASVLMFLLYATGSAQAMTAAPVATTQPMVFYDTFDRPDGPAGNDREPLHYDRPV